MAGYAAGRYRLKVTAQGFSESKEKKTPFFFLEGEPVAVKDGDDWYETEFKYPRTIALWLTDKTVANVTEKLQALGWPGGSWATLNTYSFVGQEIEVDCKMEPSRAGDGKLFEKWELPYGGDREPTPSDPSIAKQLDAMFGKVPPKAAVRKPAAKTPVASAANGKDDDLPF